MLKVTILGMGSWAASMSHLLAANPNINLYFWGRSVSKIQNIRESGFFPHPKSLVPCHEQYTLTSDFGLAVSDADYIICAVPSAALREIMALLQENCSILPPVISLTKGLDAVTGHIISDTWLEEFPNLKLFALSGPNLAAEVALEKPMKTMLAGNVSNNEFESVLALFNYARGFYVETTNDLRGIEWCGAIKNIVAILAGAWDGLELGASGKGCLITRTMKEIAIFLEKEGAQASTLYSNAGLGDLVITSFSPLSRNYQAGFLLSQGYSLEEVVEKLQGQVSEGIYTARLLKGRGFVLSDLVCSMVDGKEAFCRKRLISRLSELI